MMTAHFGAIDLNRNAAVAWVCLVALCLLIYSFELSNFNLSIDEEYYAFSANDSLINLGRWSHAAIRYLIWDQPILPFAPLIVFAMLLARAHLLLLGMLQVDRLGGFELIAFAAFAAFPVWYAQLEFLINVLPVGFGILAATAAGWLLTMAQHKSPLQTARNWLLASLLMAFAIGAYQSFIFYFLVIGLGVATDRLLHGSQIREILRLAGRFAGVAIGAVILWYLILQIFMFGFDKQTAPYVGSFFKASAFFADPAAIVAAAGTQLIAIYVTNWLAFGSAAYVFGGALLAAIAGLLITASNRRLLVGLLIGLIFVTPMGLNLLTGGQLPLRTFMAAPLVVWLMLFLAQRHVNMGPAKRGFLVLAALIAIAGIFVQATVHARAWSILKHDQNLAMEIKMRSMQALGNDIPNPIRIDINGFIAPQSVYPMVPTTTAGASFFEWDGGSPHRMVRLMNLIGYHQFVSLANARRPAFAAVYRQMPVWPRAGSVRRVGDVILVKLSP
ncbi:MAG: hypothetical protein CMH67_02250 [Nisaea sp.]|nr:hypothetical protein [Nisaea sp.]OUX98887.1 MAG: hypothetical protein CBB86_02365 [Candidatus Endolissoclinum sp. TMED26]